MVWKLKSSKRGTMSKGDIKDTSQHFKLHHWKHVHFILQFFWESFNPLTHSYVMTWFAFSCSWLRLSPPMGGGFSRGLDFWFGVVGQRLGPVVVISSRSKSWSLAMFSFCKASYSTSGWFQIWQITGNSQINTIVKVTVTAFCQVQQTSRNFSWWAKMLTKIITCVTLL